MKQRAADFFGLATALLALTACGDASTNAALGTPGRVALEEPPGENCEFGGEAIVMGFDANGDSQLTGDEVTDTFYICDGAPGTNITVEIEQAGANCANGGFQLFADGTSVGYVCNGADGSNGTNGSNGSNGSNGADGTAVTAVAEPPGGDCTNGGYEIFEDGVSIGFLCNGIDGADGTDGTSVTVTVESPGTNCTDGGFQVFQDGVSQGFLCHGIDGTNGTDGTSVTVAVEAPGTNCAAGGFEVFQDGVSQGFICNGEGTAGGGGEIYVDANHPSCTNAEPGTMAAPNCLLEAGLFYNAFQGTIHVAQGNYGTLNPTVDATLIGGYESTTWARDPEVYVTTLQPGISENAHALEVDSGVTFALDGFQLLGASGGTQGAAVVQNQGDLSLIDCMIDANVYEGTNSRTALSSSGTLFAVNNDILGGIATVGNNADSRALLINGGTAIFVNNVIDGGTGDQRAYAIWQDDAPSTYVHNTIVGGTTNHVTTSYDSVEFTIHNRSASGSDLGIHFVNNILVEPVATNPADVHTAIAQHTNVGDIHYVNNLLDGTTLAQRSHTITPEQVTSLADFNSCTSPFATGSGCGSQTTGNVQGSAVLNADYTLQPSSAALDVGLSDVSAFYTARDDELTHDKTGTPRDTATPDAGAYELIP